jgi:hypothetical protein
MIGDRRFRLFRRDRLTVDQAAQLAIVILSPLAIWLLASDSPTARWGFVVGLASQPAWIYAAARARQFGTLAVAVFYLAIWILGIVNHFPELLS